MPWTWLDLLLFTGSTVGLSWLLTRSALLERPRRAVAGVPFLGPLLQCIVCTSAWVAVGLTLLLPHATIFSRALPRPDLVDGVFLVGWSLAAAWVLSAALERDASMPGWPSPHA